MCQAAGLLGGPFPFIFLHNTKELERWRTDLNGGARRKILPLHSIWICVPISGEDLKSAKGPKCRQYKKY
jgi:hypothetical protein